MNNKVIKSNIQLLVPYRKYNNLTAIYKQYRDLSEMEAIVISFIYAISTDNNLKDKYFYKEFFQTFNLDKNKWLNFFDKLINNLINNEIIIHENKNIDNFKINEDTLCGEISLVDKIASNVKEKHFLGLDSKEITKSLAKLRFAIFKDILSTDKLVIESNNSDVIVDSKILLLDIKHLHQICVQEYEQDFYSIDNYANKIEEQAKEAYIRKTNNDLEHLEIAFQTISGQLNFTLIDNKTINLSSDTQSIMNILDKYRQEKMSATILLSILNCTNISLDDFHQLEDDRAIDLININDYIQIKAQIQDFKNNYSLDEENLILENNNIIYKVCSKSFKLLVANEDIEKNIDLLVKYPLEIKILDLIQKEFSKGNYKAFNLINYLDDIDKSKLKELVMLDLPSYLNLDHIKNYVINNWLFTFNEQHYFQCLESSYISEKNWEIILKNGVTEIASNLITKNNYQFTNRISLVIQKLLILVKLSNKSINDVMDINNLDYFKNLKPLIQEYQNIINIKNLDQAKETNLLVRNKIIELNKQYGVSNFDDWIIHNSLIKYEAYVLAHIKNLLNHDINNFNNLLMQLSRTLEKLKIHFNTDSINKAIDLINGHNNNNIYTKLKQANQFRNKYIHLTEDKLPSNNEQNEITSLINQCQSHIDWVNNNLKEIFSFSKESK